MLLTLYRVIFIDTIQRLFKILLANIILVFYNNITHKIDFISSTATIIPIQTSALDMKPVLYKVNLTISPKIILNI